MTESEYILRIDAPGMGSITVFNSKSLNLAKQLLNKVFEEQGIKEANTELLKVDEKQHEEEKKEKPPKHENTPPINGIREKQIMEILWGYPESTTLQVAADLEMSPTGIYTKIRSLEKDGMILGAYMKTEGETGKGKKHYSVTDKGRIHYQLKLEEPNRV